MLSAVGLFFFSFSYRPDFSQAEAEQMAKKADAWKEYKEAALVDMMMKVLPQVVIAENNFFYQPRSGKVWIFLNSVFYQLRYRKAWIISDLRLLLR